MSNNHSHGESSHKHRANKKTLTLSFILIAGYMFVEIVGGILTNSLALLSDAGHMLSDAVALGLSLTAVILGQKPATPEKTFGYKRSEILAALLNGIALVLLSAYILYEAIHRLSSPPEVIGKGMMIISVVGLIVNIVVYYILSRGESSSNLNVRSALMHVLGDLLGSVGAITAAVLILLFEWNIADPIASMIVSVLVLYSAWHILKDAIHILMESKPADIDTNEVIRLLKTIPEVESVHDLHIWMITQEFPAMTLHIRVNANSDRDAILEKALDILIEYTDIHHITIQIEGRELKNYDTSCQPCE